VADAASLALPPPVLQVPGAEHVGDSAHITEGHVGTIRLRTGGGRVAGAEGRLAQTARQTYTSEQWESSNSTGRLAMATP
jgi:hypothetical protein